MVIKEKEERAIISPPIDDNTTKVEKKHEVVSLGNHMLLMDIY
jgi:hypothetical protein